MQSQCQSRITSARALGFPDIIRGNPGPTDQRAQRHGNWATASRYFVHATSIGSFSESLLKLSKAKVQEREREREREREAHGFRRPMEICAHHPLRVICPPARAALGRQIAAGVARTGKELPSNLLFSRPSLSLSLSLYHALALFLFWRTRSHAASISAPAFPRDDLSPWPISIRARARARHSSPGWRGEGGGRGHARSEIVPGAPRISRYPDRRIYPPYASARRIYSLGSIFSPPRPPPPPSPIRPSAASRASGGSRFPP